MVFNRFPSLELVRPFFHADTVAEWNISKSHYLIAENFTLKDGSRGHLKCFLYYQGYEDDFSKAECALVAGHYPIGFQDQWLGIVGNLILAHKFKVASGENTPLFEGKLATVPDLPSLNQLLSDFNLVRTSLSE